MAETVTWDTYLFDRAMAKTDESVALAGRKERCQSQVVSLAARLFFVLDVLAVCVYVPWTVLGMSAGLAESWWKWEVSDSVGYYGQKFLKKLDRFFNSIVGALISPGLVHYGKDVNWAAGLAISTLIAACFVLPGWLVYNGYAVFLIH